MRIGEAIDYINLRRDRYQQGNRICSITRVTDKQKYCVEFFNSNGNRAGKFRGNPASVNAALTIINIKFAIVCHDDANTVVPNNTLPTFIVGQGGLPVYTVTKV
jgi:hypothetical protein